MKKLLKKHFSFIIAVSENNAGKKVRMRADK